MATLCHNFVCGGMVDRTPPPHPKIVESGVLDGDRATAPKKILLPHLYDVLRTGSTPQF